MAKAGGSLGNGRRLAHETPAIPDGESLGPEARATQRVLARLDAAAGGRMGRGGSIPVDSVPALADYLDGWARRLATARNGRTYFAGRPGLWHALDELYPLQDPNRWDALRLAITRELEDRGWERVAPPRGSTFYLP